MGKRVLGWYRHEEAYILDCVNNQNMTESEAQEELKSNDLLKKLPTGEVVKYVKDNESAGIKTKKDGAVKL